MTEKEICLRDEFAGKAMQPLIVMTENIPNITTEMVAIRAYVYADAMIAVRQRKPFIQPESNDIELLARCLKVLEIGTCSDGTYGRLQIQLNAFQIPARELIDELTIRLKDYER